MDIEDKDYADRSVYKRFTMDDGSILEMTKEEFDRLVACFYKLSIWKKRADREKLEKLGEDENNSGI